MGFIPKIMKVGALLGTKEPEKRKEIIEELKQQVQHSKEQRKEEHGDSKWMQKIHKEVKSIPILSAVDDLIEGISELEKVEELIVEHPNSPYAWLIFAEALQYHKKAFFTVHGLKATFDFVGTIMDIGAEAVGNTIDRERWTYVKALQQAIYLAEKEEPRRKETLIILGRSFQLLGNETQELGKQKLYREKAEQYLGEALVSHEEPREKGEILFYLAELARERQQFKSYMKYLKDGKDQGFVPAQRELKLFLEHHKISYAPHQLQIPEGVIPVKEFEYSYQKHILHAAVSGVTNVVVKQTEKISKWGNKALDFTIDKFLK